MNEIYNKCAQKMKEIAALCQIADLMQWDQSTMMPKKGALARAAQTAAIAGVIHEKLTDPDVGRMLKELSASPLSQDESACVKGWLRDHERGIKIPEELVREIAETTTLANETWIEARKKSDFSIFKPLLEKIVTLKQKQAKALGYSDLPYDPLLDEYEPGMTVRELDPLIENLRKGLVPIVESIAGSKANIDNRVLKQSCMVSEQEALCRELSTKLGLDPFASRLDKSAHPFCCSIASPTDVRITNRYNENWLPQALYGVIHETGHALYEQGFDEKYSNTPLAKAASLGIHESQSRLWENFVGRGREFLSYLLPLLKKKFAKELNGIDTEMFYRAVNLVEPSAIRVEADEMTYSLHIIIRYEIEKQLIAGDVEVKDLPEIWNRKMKDYLGITPQNDAEGVLQDIHWAMGYFGYFPTYLLGNLYAAQWWRAVNRDIPCLGDEIARGEFAPLLEWLRKKIHRQGRRFSPGELVRHVTGESLNGGYFIDYLKNKFGDIYRIKL